MDGLWNPWHGCKKYSEGCLNCYVFRIDGKIEKNANEVKLNKTFDLPRQMGRDGYKIKPGTRVYTCFSSDFFLDTADEWRRDAWSIIKSRPDLDFVIITKRILRFYNGLPDDWGDGYDNVTIGCTCENQKRADERLPFFLDAPIKHKFITCEPLLEKINLFPYLDRRIDFVMVGGESGDGARICDFDWVTSIREDCVEAGVRFSFKQTGAKFVKDGKLFNIPRNRQHSQAKKANIDFII